MNVTDIKDLEILEGLQMLYRHLKYSDKFNIKKLIDDKVLSGDEIRIMRDAKIFRNTGSRGRGARYEWNTIPPNLKMAEEIRRQVRIYQKNTISDRRLNKQKSLTVVKENSPIIDKFKVSKLSYTVKIYLFGLIKIKTKYYYLE